MTAADLSRSLRTLFSELVDGAPETSAFMLNRGDPGLLVSLDRLSAAAASERRSGGASIAAHVDHVRYGLSLMNRWAAGENAFADANWAASWETGAVSEAEWTELRRALKHEARAWLATLAIPREMDDIELNGVIGSIAHLAYHLGAIRQIDRAIQGPPAND